jgi:hypothetical protein
MWSILRVKPLPIGPTALGDSDGYTRRPDAMRKILFADGFALLCLLGACDALGSAHQQPNGFSEVSGRLDQCRISGEKISLAVRTDRGLKQVDLAQGTASWPSENYRNAIGTPYQVAGECPPRDAAVSVMTCEGCPPTMIAAEIVSEPQGSSQGKRRLWIFQQFEDRLRSGDAAYWHVLGLSLMLARHNQLDGQSRGFWLRDRLSRSLDTYSSRERAAMMTERFGRPAYSAATPRIVEIYEKYHDQIGLVKAVPYSTSAFVGGWGHFVTEIYVEGRNGALAKVF